VQRKGNILAILLIGVSFVIVPAFAEPIALVIKMLTPCCDMVEPDTALEKIESFTVAPGDDKTINFRIREVDFILFSVSVTGGSNDDLDLTIRDSSYGALNCCTGRIADFYSNRVSLEWTDHQSETRTLSFEFDNSFSSISRKNVVFTYTVDKRETDEESTERMNPQGGGCLIATATFGSELSPQVQQLRELRDNYLLKTESGSIFMSGFNQFYYSFSPTIADWERQNPVFKEAVKLAITPLLTSLSLLNYADIDSEAEILGYGISLILLNVGMYFVAPVGIVVLVRRKF